jgi:RNA-dependent RNA polymerase
VLEEDEVYLSYLMDNSSDAQQIEGEVVVTRNPCLHPGDIRVLKAVRRPEVHSKLSHLVNCLVLPQKGRIPLSCMMAGGDLDGDLYFVSWDERLIPNRIVPPMDYKSNFRKKKNKKNLKYTGLFLF